MKKKLLKLFLSIAAILSLAVPVSASITVPERSSNTSWVEDYANVLSSSTEQYIQEYSQILADNFKACIVVVTVDFVQSNIEDYCYAIFNNWQIGDKDLNNGVLLLMSVGDDDYYMMVGRGISDSFTTAKIRSILDNYLEPYFAKKDYDSGARAAFEASYDLMVNEIYNPGNNNNGGGGGGSTGMDNLYSFIGGLIVLIICIVIVVSIARSISRVRRYYEPNVYYTRPRYRTYTSPYTYRPSNLTNYDRTPSYHSTPSSTYTRPSSTYTRPSSSSSSSGLRSTGTGTSFGGSTRGSGAGRRH